MTRPGSTPVLGRVLVACGRGPACRVALTSIDVLASALGEGDYAAIGDVSSPDGALTLLMCDIDAIAAIREELDPAHFEALLRDERAIVTQIVGHHSGRIANSHDDGFMVAFDSAHAGLRCAIELQRAFSDGLRAGDRELQLRVGVHTGFVIAQGQDLLGRNVVLAARVAGAAHGGEILVSAKLKEYTETDPSFTFADHGRHHFKGVIGEHRLYAVQWDS